MITIFVDQYFIVVVSNLFLIHSRYIHFYVHITFYAYILTRDSVGTNSRQNLSIISLQQQPLSFYRLKLFLTFVSFILHRIRTMFVMNVGVLAVLLVACNLLQSSAFMRSPASTMQRMKLSMIEITTGVEFNTIAREWRLKWSDDDNKKSLASVQQTLVVFTNALKKIDGVKSVQRIVCGGCLDFKVITALSADKYADWVSFHFLS